MSPYCLTDPQLEALLRDDCPYGDATTHGLGIGEQRGRIVFRTRGNMVLCGVEEALRLGQLRGLEAIAATRNSGDALLAGEEILSLEGKAAALHAVWKTAQTLMEYQSGIATAARDIVNAARRINPNIGVACTRKNFPGTKSASIKAILSGGASIHRLGLSETVLIFAEHRAFLGKENPAVTIQRLHKAWPERLISVEVANKEEALLWQRAGADILQLEKLTPEEVRSLKQQIPAQASTRIAAAGGINSANAAAYAEAGADILVTSSPYFAPPRDVAVTITSY